MKLRWIKGDWEFGKFKLQMKKDGCADAWVDVPCVEEKQKDAIHEVAPVWCEHFIWKPRTEHRQYDCWGYLKSPTAHWQNVADKWTVCPICQAPRPSMKAQEMEKKEQRKLAAILQHVIPPSGQFLVNNHYHAQAQAAIDAVIECYLQWSNIPRTVAFPEYLKEKML